MMKKVLFTLAVALMVFMLTAQKFSSETKTDGISGATKPMAKDGNSLFHKTDEVKLKPGTLLIAGEVEKPGKVDFDKLYKREVFVKEATYSKAEGIDFIGAYRYSGYSLFDILNSFNLQKKNSEIFPPTIDLYLIIENSSGESVVFSWSEIFHTNNPHQIVIATEMAPIVPYRKEVNYAMGNTWKVVASNDLFAYRVLVDPVKITIRSFDSKEYLIDRDIKTMSNPEIKVFLSDILIQTINPFTDNTKPMRYYSSFYGMGMGYHPAKYFQGPSLVNFLENTIDLFDASLISNGLVCFAGADGYRTIFSFSELFNRTDQVFSIFSVPDGDKKQEGVRIFHPAEFYADRSVKLLSEMYIFQHK